MIALVKALIPGTILTFVISLIIGSAGSSASYLNIHSVSLSGQSFYWSWPLFLVATGVSWGILLLMD